MYVLRGCWGRWVEEGTAASRVGPIMRVLELRGTRSGKHSCLQEESEQS